MSKEKKVFKKGDVVKCIDADLGKLPVDCHEFIMTYKKFKVLDVNDNFNIDLGYRLQENGNPYYFNPKRFELLNGTAPTVIIGKDDESKSKAKKKSQEEFL